MQDGERFHGMGEWAWAAGIAPLLGPWRLGAVQLVYQRKGGFDPHKQLDFLSRHERHERLHHADRDALDDVDRPTRARRYPQKFRLVCSAGEPLNPEAIRWFREQYGLTVLDYYGLTESYPLVANYPFMEVREGSMGRPMPGWDVAILDEDEQPVPQGERGEICLRARSNPHYPLGYWRNDEAAEETFGGEWFHTKDAARFDEDGYVWYEGRADDVIIAAGYRIGPFEVESACLEHPAVAEAAAVASPDERRGNVVKAFIVARRRPRGLRRARRGDPGASCATGCRRYAYPRRIEFVDELPKTLTGKIRRIELRQAEMEAAKERRWDQLPRVRQLDPRLGPAKCGGELAAAAGPAAERGPPRCCRCGRRGWSASPRSRCWALAVAADGRRAARRRGRCCGSAAGRRGAPAVVACDRVPARGAARRCSASRSLGAARRASPPGLDARAAAAARWDELGGGLVSGAQALGTVRLPYDGRGPVAGARAAAAGSPLLMSPALLACGRATGAAAATRSSRWWRCSCWPPRPSSRSAARGRCCSASRSPR